MLTEGGWLLNQSHGRPMLTTLVRSDKRSTVVEPSADARDRCLAAAIRRMITAPGQRTRDLAGADVVAHSDYPHLHNALMRSTAIGAFN